MIIQSYYRVQMFLVFPYCCSGVRFTSGLGVNRLAGHAKVVTSLEKRFKIGNFSKWYISPKLTFSVFLST